MAAEGTSKGVLGPADMAAEKLSESRNKNVK